MTAVLRWGGQDEAEPKAAATPSSTLEDVGLDGSAPEKGSSARDCGDFAAHCLSGYTFFRVDTSPRSTADQYDATHEYVYIVYGASVPGTTVSTGTSYGTIVSGTGSQSGAYSTLLNAPPRDTPTPSLPSTTPTA